MIGMVLLALYWFKTALYIMIFIRAIASWFPVLRGSQIMRFVYAATDPVIDPVRYLLDRSPLGGPGMMIDFSPIIAMFFVEIVYKIIFSLLRGL